MAKDVCVRIGRAVRLLRGHKGWTQTMLADHAGLSREHLSELENGHKEMGVRTLAQLALALDTKMSDLLRGLD